MREASSRGRGRGNDRFEGAPESSTFECLATAEMVAGTQGRDSSCLPVWEFLCMFKMVKIVRTPKISLKPNCGLREKKNHVVNTLFALSLSFFFN